WFVDGRGSIGRAAAGVIETVATVDGVPTALAAGADGNVWVTVAGKSPQRAIARVSPDGNVTRFTTGLTGSPGEIAAGPDGALWFTLQHGVGRITTLGAMTAVDTPGLRPGLITTGGDGAIWFSDTHSAVLGRIGPSAPAAAPPVLGHSFVARTKRGVV